MSKTALLVMDVQNGIVKNYANDDGGSYLARVKTAVDAAHSADIPVFFIVVRFRDGYPEVSPRNKSFSRIAASAGNAMTADSDATQPAIAPGENDLVIAKKRVSAFAGSDLEMILQAQGIDHLVLCGIATSGVVLSTLRQAADKDYQLTVLSDGCADQDDEVHRVLLEKVFPRQAEVMTVQEWAKA